MRQHERDVRHAPSNTKESLSRVSPDVATAGTAGDGGPTIPQSPTRQGKGHGPHGAQPPLVNALKGYAKTGSIRGAAEYAGLSTPAAGRLLAGTKQRLPVLQVELELFDFFNEARTTTDRNLAWMRTAMEGAELNARIAESASQESQAVAKSLRIDLDVLRTTLPKLNEQREHLAVQLEKVNRFAEMQRQGVEQLAAHHRELQELIAPLAMALQRLLPEIQAYTGAAEALSSWVVQRLGAESLPEVMLLKAKRDAVIQAAGGLLPLLPRFLRLAGIMPEE